MIEAIMLWVILVRPWGSRFLIIFVDQREKKSNYYSPYFPECLFRAYIQVLTPASSSIIRPVSSMPW